MGGGPFLSRWRWPHSAHGCVSIMIASEGGRSCRCRDCACGPGRAAGEPVAAKSGTRDAAGVDMHPSQLATPPRRCASWWMRSSPRGGPWPSSRWILRAPSTPSSASATTSQPVSPWNPVIPERRAGTWSARREQPGRARFPTPEPVALGEPGAGYLLPWLVQTWLPGVTAAEQDPGGSAAFAHDLAEFISGVRGISTGGRTFSGSGRGGDLASHDVQVRHPAQPRARPRDTGEPSCTDRGPRRTTRVRRSTEHGAEGTGLARRRSQPTGDSPRTRHRPPKVIRIIDHAG